MLVVQGLLDVRRLVIHIDFISADDAMSGRQNGVGTNSSSGAAITFSDVLHRDLLRHASYTITANVYDEAVSDEKREAHSGVMRLVATRTRIRTQADDGKMATA